MARPCIFVPDGSPDERISFLEGTFCCGARSSKPVKSEKLDDVKSRISHIKASSSDDMRGRFDGVGMVPKDPVNPS